MGSREPAGAPVDTGGSTPPHNANTPGYTATNISRPNGMPNRPGRRNPKPNNPGGPNNPNPNKPNPNKNVTPLEKIARQEVRFAYMPQRQAFKRALQQAQLQTDQRQTQTQSIYGALQGNLAGLVGPYQAGVQGVTADYLKNIQGVPGMLTQNLGQAAPGEDVAGNNYLGTLSTGTLGQLSSEEARNLAYNTSTQRQGSMESAVQQRNALTDLANLQGDIRQQRMDMNAQIPSAVLSRLDQLKQQAINNRIAMGQLAVSQGGLGVQQGQLGLSQQQFNMTAAQQQAMMDFYNKLLADPSALSAFYGMGGTFFGGGQAYP